jgi:hypothetical protein
MLKVAAAVLLNAVTLASPAAAVEHITDDTNHFSAVLPAEVPACVVFPKGHRDEASCAKLGLAPPLADATVRTAVYLDLGGWCAVLVSHRPGATREPMSAEQIDGFVSAQGKRVHGMEPGRRWDLVDFGGVRAARFILESGKLGAVNYLIQGTAGLTLVSFASESLDLQPLLDVSGRSMSSAELPLPEHAELFGLPFGHQLASTAERWNKATPWVVAAFFLVVWFYRRWRIHRSAKMKAGSV